jgi:thiamine pyrophosphokinase
VDGLHALILAGGGDCHRDALDAAWPGWSAGVELVIAADGGLRLAGPLGVRVDAWVGDGDSVDPAGLATLRAEGVPVRLVAADKDQSDAQLALEEALQRGATEVTVVGGLAGPRFDHAIANIGLLAHHGLIGLPARLLADDARVSLVRAPEPDGSPTQRSLSGRVGDIVSLLPHGPDVEGVTTSGLRYPLHDEPLPLGPARGLSNVRLSADAALTVRRGLLLVVEVPATLAP